MSLKEIKLLSPYFLLRLINKAKNFLKKDKVWKELCSKYNEDVDIIDYIPTKFGNLNVSANTDHGIVTLNYKLLCDGDFYKDYSYLIHEYAHWFAQCYSTKPTKSSTKEDYLQNKHEQDAFKNQVEYIAEHFGKGEAEDYVDNLLEYHEVDDKEEKEDLEDVLLEKV